MGFYRLVSKYSSYDLVQNPFFQVVYSLVNWHSYGKYPCLIGESTISMAIFNSYVSHYQRVIPPKKNIMVMFSDSAGGLSYESWVVKTIPQFMIHLFGSQRDQTCAINEWPSSELGLLGVDPYDPYMIHMWSICDPYIRRPRPTQGGARKGRRGTTTTTTTTTTNNSYYYKQQLQATKKEIFFPGIRELLFE